MKCVSVRKLKDIMVRKWDYGELECEILEKYLTYSDMMTASVIMIEDEER